ncbi:MAG: CoA transferase subunit A, partial [Chloroflexota bacterium]|nr:CoA transferase subunit A [Chloroflexota bacterium]
GAPYIPTRTLLGSDIPSANGTFMESTSPFDGTKLLLIPPIAPDITVISCQSADPDGTVYLDGPWGVSQEAALAAKAVIVICEDIAPAEARPVLRYTLVPGTKVVAVVHEPGGCHPSPLQGRYGRDHEFFHEYHRATRTVEGFDAWTREWVMGVADRAAYLRKLGPRWVALRAPGRQMLEPM